MRLILIILVFISLQATSANAQTQYDVALVSGLVKSPDHSKPYKQYAENNSGTVQFVFSGLFLFYKTFISSQDYQRCQFSPSCSEYAILSIKEHGFFKGFLLGLDRYTRCNGFNRKFYDLDPHTKRFNDPVK